MSIKTKLTSLITTFVLLCSLLTVGVFAVKNTTFNVGGNIEFVANGINANIKLTDNGLQGASLPEGVTAGNDVMSEIVLNDTKSKEDVENQFSKWSNLDLTFGESGVATIELSITNNSTTDYIDVILSVEEGTAENIKITAKNNDGSIQGLVYPETTESYTITFTVKNNEYSASATGFTIDFGLQKKTIEDIPSYDKVTNLTFTCDTANKKATLTDGASATGEVVIPAYVKSGDVICSVTSIGNSAFLFSGLTSIIIPDSVTSIGESAFAMSGLTSITIGNGVTSIGKSAFDGCTLTSITIPGSVTNIEETTFYGCNQLKSVIIQDGVTSIGDTAFINCDSLESVIIPASVTSIGGQIFCLCNSLTSIVVESRNAIYDSRENCNAIIETSTNTLIAGCKNTIIPNTVEAIGDDAFISIDTLTSITIPDSVTSIGDSAFEDCDSLTSITIGNGVTSIGDRAFFYSGLTSITIPNSVTSIGDGAFEECENLTTVNYRGTESQWNAIEGIEDVRIPDGCTINFLG